jgi:hypothetical protein
VHNRTELRATAQHADAAAWTAEVSVEFVDPNGGVMNVPAFWAGGQEWRVRYVSGIAGVHRYRWTVTGAVGTGLHGQQGTIELAAGVRLPLLEERGRLRIGANPRQLVYGDGEPFFWLGDTWWLGLVQREGWGLSEFRTLAADRVAKGFTVVQIVAGLYPDLPPFDPRGFNEAGYPWELDYARLNPAYFDAADQRIATLVQAGLTPCIVGAWGYHLPWLGLERMKQHWRYLVARWGSYPVVWCLAGEATMPYYLSEQREVDTHSQKQGWSEIGRFVRAIDPYRNLITIHPCIGGRQDVEDESVLDIEMYGTGHGDWSSVPFHMRIVPEAYARTPPMPAINAEVCYEGHMQANWQNVQRFMFWTSLLSGTTGYTYGAGGIWQMNTHAQPHGPSPQGVTYENTPWDIAAQLPGARQLGFAKELLARYSWPDLQPMPNSVDPRWSSDDYFLPYAAGIQNQVRFVYIPGRIYQWSGPVVKELEQGVAYHACYFDPITGTDYDLGRVTAVSGAWQAPTLPLAQDWVLVLERIGE